MCASGFALQMLQILSPLIVVVGAFGALLPCIQIGKMVQERNAHGISVPFVAGGLVTAFVWLLYAFALREPAMIVPDVVAVLVAVAYLGTVLVLRRRYPQPTLDDELALLLDADAETLVLAA